MTEEKELNKFCVYCGAKKLKQIAHDESSGYEDITTVYLCDGCKQWFALRGGSDIYEWVHECAGQLGIDLDVLDEE
jgi:hypothetical protein